MGAAAIAASNSRTDDVGSFLPPYAMPAFRCREPSFGCSTSAGVVIARASSKRCASSYSALRFTSAPAKPGRAASATLYDASAAARSPAFSLSAPR